MAERTEVTEQFELNQECTFECCKNDLVNSYHPNIAFVSTVKKQGQQHRSFCSNWFKEYNWISFCITRNKVCCYYCRKNAKRIASSVLNNRTERAFTMDGFDNWKKAKQKFREHECSHSHKQALLSHQTSLKGSVASLLSNSLCKDQADHRTMLMKLLSSLKLLLRQGSAIRGHTEEEGNLYQVLKCRSEDVPGLEAWLKKGDYRSHDIVNELIELMYMQLLRKLLAQIRVAEWYSIIADETRDLSGTEQFAISLRWVDADYNVYEDLIGMVDVESTTAEKLTSAIKDTLLRCVLPLAQCRGQAYDGAANMAGSIKGVAKCIQNEQPSALFVHCLAHNLNLCLQDCSRQCSTVRNALSLTSGVATIIRASPKRLAIFKHL